MVLSKQSAVYRMLVKEKVIWCTTSHSPYHLKLASGEHSCEYISIGNLLKSPNLLRMTLAEMDKEALSVLLDTRKFICKGAYGIGIGIALCYTFPELTTARVILDDSYVPKLSRNFVYITDVLTTGSTLPDYVENADCILCLFNRSGSRQFHEIPVFSCVDILLDKYPSHDCPYCKAGSIALDPKTDWDEVQRAYSLE